MAIDNFEVITFFVPDVAKTRDFYKRVFGVEEIFGDDNSSLIGFAGTMVNLLATSETEDLMAPVPVAPSGVRSLMTVRVENVDAEIARLAGLGVTMLNGPIDRPWGRRTASFADPAGYVWELAQVL